MAAAGLLVLAKVERLSAAELRTLLCQACLPLLCAQPTGPTRGLPQPRLLPFAYALRVTICSPTLPPARLSRAPSVSAAPLLRSRASEPPPQLLRGHSPALALQSKMLCF